MSRESLKLSVDGLNQGRRGWQFDVIKDEMKDFSLPLENSEFMEHLEHAFEIGYMRNFVQLCFLAAAASIFAGCALMPGAAPSRAYKGTHIRQGHINSSVEDDLNGNFVLFISNQSFAVSPVDIKVFIDGKKIASGCFDVGSQRNYKLFPLRLSPGRHEIVAESSKGHARIVRTFEVSDGLWAGLGYWFNPTESGVETGRPHFTFRLKPVPQYFTE